jgi:hypothetical protein
MSIEMLSDMRRSDLKVADVLVIRYNDVRWRSFTQPG